MSLQYLRDVKYVVIVELILRFISHMTSVCWENWTCNISLLYTSSRCHTLRSVLNIIPSCPDWNKACPKIRSPKKCYLLLTAKISTELSKHLCLLQNHFIWLGIVLVKFNIKNLYISVTTPARAILILLDHQYSWRNKREKPLQALSIFWGLTAKQLHIQLDVLLCGIDQRYIVCFYISDSSQRPKGCYFRIDRESLFLSGACLIFSDGSKFNTLREDHFRSNSSYVIFAFESIDSPSERFTSKFCPNFYDSYFLAKEDSLRWDWLS